MSGTCGTQLVEYADSDYQAVAPLGSCIGAHNTREAPSGLTVLVGVGIFLNWAIQHHLLGPEARVALGYLGAIGLENCRFRGHLNVFADVAQLELRIHARTIAAGDHDLGGLGLKPLELDLDGIAADRQQVEDVVAGRAANLRAHVARCSVLDGDRGARKHGAAGVGDAAENVGSGDLRMRRRRQQKAYHAEDGTPDEPHSASLLVV